jgi:hypothetical protein
LGVGAAVVCSDWLEPDSVWVAPTVESELRVSFDHKNIVCVDIEHSGFDLDNNGDSGSQHQTNI